MAEEIKYVYFKRNVAFTVGVRLFPKDSNGLVLNDMTPYVNIEETKLKDFLIANKDAIGRGLIIQIDEPSFDFVTENTINDEEAEELVKNLFILRKRLPQINSEATVAKLYNAAKAQKRSAKILELIEDRLEELTPAGMRGTSWQEEEEKDTDAVRY